jgi:hypothetical protein
MTNASKIGDLIWWGSREFPAKYVSLLRRIAVNIIKIIVRYPIKAIGDGTAPLPCRRHNVCH